MPFTRNKQLEIPESILSFQKGINRLQEIDDLLSKVKVVDPAVGSGAFPLGMLTEIVKARDTITAYMIIESQGYELDITEARRHHEIYLSDARKVAPEKRKTVIRHPIRKVEQI